MCSASGKRNAIMYYGELLLGDAIFFSNVSRIPTYDHYLVNNAKNNHRSMMFFCCNGSTWVVS